MPVNGSTLKDHIIEHEILGITSGEGADEVAKLDVLLDEDGDLTYVGEATPGTATSAASWRIFRMDESASGDEELLKRYADGVATFTKIWDDRATYGY
jgi:hypothetical protein